MEERPIFVIDGATIANTSRRAVDYDAFCKALDGKKVHFWLSDDKKTIFITEKSERKAGRRSQVTVTGEAKTYTSVYDGKELSYSMNVFYHYADVLALLQTLTDEQVMQQLKGYRKRKKISEYTGMSRLENTEDAPMAPATYYRHKKQMMSSAWYKALDKNRLSDLEYLRSVPGNEAF